MELVLKEAEVIVKETRMRQKDMSAFWANASLWTSHFLPHRSFLQSVKVLVFPELHVFV